MTASEHSRKPKARIVLGCSGAASMTPPSAGFPVFRGRRQFALADYGSDGGIWFDLNAGEVAGTISHRIIDDAALFQTSVLSVIAGILAQAVGVVALHAACVVLRGRGILLAAPSGTGKSTLALALAMRGWGLLSDEWTFVSEIPTRLHAWGMKTPLKLMPDAARFFPELSRVVPQVALNGELSYEVDAARLFGVARTTKAEPAAVFHLERGIEGRSECFCQVVPCSAEQTLRALKREIEEQPPEAKSEGFDGAWILERVSQLPAFTARFSGDPASVAACLEEKFTEVLA